MLDTPLRDELFADLEKRGVSPGHIVVMWPVLSRFVQHWLIEHGATNKNGMVLRSEWLIEMDGIDEQSH